MREFLVAICALIGASFMILAAIGLLRLPDVYSRMHAATKGGTLGVTGALLAVAVHHDDLSIASQAFLVIGLVFLTAPVGAHFIARAAYLSETPLWHGTVLNELGKIVCEAEGKSSASDDNARR